MLMRAGFDVDTDCARASSRGSTRPDSVYLDYTGAALYPALAGRARRATAGDGASSATRTPTAPRRGPAPRRSTQARALTLQLLDADPGEYDVVFTANASARAPHRRRGVPVPPGLAAGAHRRQPQLGQRHPRPCPPPRRAVAYTPLDAELRGRRSRPVA